MTKNEKFIYIAEKHFFDNDMEAYISVENKEYIISIWYLGGRTMYSVNKNKVETPVDLYFEVQKLINMIPFKRDKDGSFYVHNRIIYATSHGKEFKIGILIENPDETIIIKTIPDMEKIYNVFPYLKTRVDFINYGLNLIFERYGNGTINIFNGDIISDDLKVGEVSIDTISDKNNIQDRLMQKYL